jgi:geranylgeranyl reductase family protein
MKPFTTHDVVIAGAGPAGASAAMSLARRGREVLLVDRETFPRDKTCGDGIPPGTVGILRELGLGDALRAAGFTPVRAIRLVSARGRDFRVEFRPRRDREEFYIAPRLRLDDLLFRHALDAGARFERAQVRAPILENGRVTGLRVEDGAGERLIRARIVIGADGATSALARALVPVKQPESHRGVSIRGYVDGIETLGGAVEFHFAGPIAPGYGWIFPTGERSANVGVLVRTDLFKKRGRPLANLLEDFLATPDVRARLAPDHRLHDVATWQLPYAVPKAQRRTVAGALLAGDAGRLVDALTGEGIHNAVVSGTIAAEVADEMLAHPDRAAAIAAGYDARCEAALGPLVRRSYRAQKYVVANPALLEAIFIAARTGRGLVSSWLNRVSTDFLVR